MSSKKQKVFGKRVKLAASYRVADSVTDSVIHDYLCSLACPRSLTVSLLFKYGEFDQLRELTIDPLAYNDAQEFRDAYAATKFLSKYQDFPGTHDKDAVAFAKFKEFELLCKQTNVRFRNLRADPLYKGSTVRLHHAVVRKISSILGPFDADEWLSMPDWGPGATTLMKRRDASPVNKFHSECGITRDLHSLMDLDFFKKFSPLWGKRLEEQGFPCFQVGNKVVTVPKDSYTNRVIAVEPGLNLFFQLGIGSMIGLRLRRCGIDLRYQDRNQRLARTGSISSALATVDLSSASDSISRAVVRELIPPDWFHAMDLCRSHYGVVEGKTLFWEKFSSMGNGFTFPLESLIFYAIAYCVAQETGTRVDTVSVYGDDVIIPVDSFDRLSEVLAFYGFKVNRSKSHFGSQFRESCGSHYFFGVDVKPIYLKSRLSSVQSVYRLANAIRRFASRRFLLPGCDSRFRNVFDRLTRMVPKALCLRIPDCVGDGGFVSNFDEATPARARFGIEGYRIESLVDVSKTYEDDREGLLLAYLWRLGNKPTSTRSAVSLLLKPEVRRRLHRRTILETIDALTPGTGQRTTGRNSVPLTGSLRSKFVKSIVQQWKELGPWW